MTTSGSANHSVPHMPAQSPFDILADEIGLVAGRIERESALRISAAIADLARKDAERELAVTRFMADLSQRVELRLASLRDGVDGVTGKDGRDGVDGKDGVNGIDGKEGPAGRDGIDGKNGVDGVDGKAGNDGENGAPGERGLTGAPGKMPIVRLWTDRIHYEGEIVQHRGASFQATCDTAKEPGLSDEWFCIAARGSDGSGFVVRGTYSEDRSYRSHDVVACNNGSFVALKDGPGICPGPDWQLCAGPGKRGEKGQPGDRGVQGERGPAGATLLSWDITADTYKAAPIMSDGSRGPVIDLHDMFEQFLGETR